MADAIYGKITGMQIMGGAITADLLAANIALVSMITSPNYDGAPPTSMSPVMSGGSVANEGFKISGLPFWARLRDDSYLKVNADFGDNMSIAGRKAATLSDFYSMAGIELRGFKMRLTDARANVTAQNVVAETYASATITKWPNDTNIFSVSNNGVTIYASGMFEIAAQCPFYFGFGEPGWCDSNRVELLRTRNFALLGVTGSGLTVTLPDGVKINFGSGETPTVPNGQTVVLVDFGTPGVQALPCVVVDVPARTNQYHQLSNSYYTIPAQWRIVGQRTDIVNGMQVVRAFDMSYYKTDATYSVAGYTVKEVVAAAFCPMVIGRGGANYAHSGVTTMMGQTLRAAVRLNAGDTISMRGFGYGSSYNQLQNGGITHTFGPNPDHENCREWASFFTIRAILPVAFSPEQNRQPNAPMPPTGTPTG